MLRFVALATLLAIASATDFYPCGNEANPTAVKVQGCEKMPCKVVKNKDAIIEVDFKSKSAAETLTAKIVATAFGIKVPYPLPKELANVCENLINDGYCPLDVDEDATYKLTFPVGAGYPEIPVNIEVKIEDQDNKTQSCFSIDIKVAKS